MATHNNYYQHPQSAMGAEHYYRSGGCKTCRHAALVAPGPIATCSLLPPPKREPLLLEELGKATSEVLKIWRFMV